MDHATEGEMSLAALRAECDRLTREAGRLAEDNARLRTEANRASGQVERQLAQQRALYALGSLISAELDLTRLLNLLLEHLQSVFKADGVVIFLRPLEGYGFRHAASHGLSDQYLKALQRHYLDGPPGIAISERIPVIIDDARTDPRMAPLTEAARIEGIRTLVKLPCIYRDQVVGFLGLHHRTPQYYTATDKALMKTFADQAAVAIQNAQLHQSVVDNAQRLNAVIEAISEPLIAYTPDRHILLVNMPFYDLIGCDPLRSPLEGMVLEAVADSAQGSKEAALSLRSLAQAPDRALNPSDYVEIELHNPWRVYRLRQSTIRDASGQVQGYLVVYHDVTQFRENQRLKDEMVAVLSHELRTPLTSILGYAKLIADRPTAEPDRRAKWATFILDKSRVLAHMIDDVLDISRLNVGRYVLQRAPTDIVQLVHRVVDEVGIVADYHVFQVESPLEVPSVALDADRMSQVFTNLFDNAVKYWPEGGVVLVQITLTGDPDGRHAMVHISVIDHGPGIPLKHREHIFEPFYRIDHTADRAAYGIGLGLALSRGIVEAHHGTLTVSDTPGGGSTFTVSLPIVSEG
ncbi:MAG: GAF domain-containing protein [Anaerolineae bacterium]|nr:GAF domain-containing protein [Anaerolineae bacterium]